VSSSGRNVGSRSGWHCGLRLPQSFEMIDFISASLLALAASHSSVPARNMIGGCPKCVFYQHIHIVHGYFIPQQQAVAQEIQLLLS